MLPDFCFNVCSTDKFQQTLYNNLIGIDYGSKTAGTTVIAFQEEGEVAFLQTTKGLDADNWLLAQLEHLQPSLISLDAPLSLPSVFSGLPGEDYFYREADRLTGAMSPMFLGGLTARAMRLRKMITTTQTKVIETYPGYLARFVIGLDPGKYKKDMGYLHLALECLHEHGFPYTCKKTPTNWHQFDALLALYSANRASKGEALIFGTVQEGQIIV
jgi:predicted nuclease with RNAse H fold